MIARVGRERALCEGERQRERHEPLLRAVVEVALEPPTLGVGGLDEPRPGRAQLLEARAQLRLQALVLEREPGGGDDPVDELGMVAQRRVVDERRDRKPGALDGRGHAARAVSRQRDRLAVDVDERVVAQPVGELERGVAERAASASRSLPGSGVSPSSTTSVATAERASRLRSSPARNASGTVSSARTDSHSSTHPEPP